MVPEQDTAEPDILESFFEISIGEAYRHGLAPVKETLGYILAKEHDFKVDGDEIEEVMAFYPPGYWYITWKDDDRTLFETPSPQAETLLNIPYNLMNSVADLRPYIVKTPDGNNEIGLDPWYPASLYDAIPLSFALLGIVDNLPGNDNTKIESLEELFRKIKLSAIENVIRIPYGRDVLLGSTLRTTPANHEQFPNHIFSFDVKRQNTVIVDREDYFRFLVEKSSIDIINLPGAVLTSYERDKGAAVPATSGNQNATIVVKAGESYGANNGPEPAVHSPERRFDPVKMITKREMVNLSRKSRKWVDDAATEADLKPCFIPKIKNSDEGFWREKAMEAMEKRKNKRG